MKTISKLSYNDYKQYLNNGPTIEPTSGNVPDYEGRPNGELAELREFAEQNTCLLMVGNQCFQIKNYIHPNKGRMSIADAWFLLPEGNQ